MKPNPMLVTLLFSFAAANEADAQVPSGLDAKPLVTITNDQDSDKTQLSVLVDKNNELQGLYSAGSGGRTIWLKDMEKKAGVPLVERDGYTVITLRSQLDRATQEGRVKAQYLVNGLFGTKSLCEFEIRRDANQGFYIRNIYTKQPVPKVHIVTSKVGIKVLQGLCPGK